MFEELFRERDPFREFDEEFQDELRQGAASGDMLLEIAQFEEEHVSDALIYISRVSEPDRNFGFFERDEGGGVPPMPVLNDHVLGEMARLQLEGRSITRCSRQGSRVPKELRVPLERQRFCG